VRSFGVPSPNVRDLAAEMYLAIKKDWHYEQALQLCAILFPKPELESKAIAALILARYKKDFPRHLCAQVKQWLANNYLDNWASVDTFCPEIMAALLSRYPELVKELKTWTKHPNRWVKRASIVSFLKLTKNEDFLDVIYEQAITLFPVADDLIHKANGWVLREAGKRDLARLERFLLTHGPAIPRTTLRYAIERFPTAAGDPGAEKIESRRASFSFSRRGQAAQPAPGFRQHPAQRRPQGIEFQINIGKV
jgi:3-methyladenine DNA glycosylase AlkD